MIDISNLVMSSSICLIKLFAAWGAFRVTLPKMSSKVESDVCCRLQVAPSGDSYEGKRRPGRKQRQTTAGWYMA